MRSKREIASHNFAETKMKSAAIGRGFNLSEEEERRWQRRFRFVRDRRNGRGDSRETRKLPKFGSRNSLASPLSDLVIFVTRTNGRTEMKGKAELAGNRINNGNNGGK